VTQNTTTNPHRSGYFGAITRSARSVLEGLAVTLTYMFRPPTTVQYPDRIPVPVPETLPERYRGFLEVDLSICTGCKACERDCPINCIAIDMEKVGEVRAITRFDIDLGKCMYCNLCVESCPVPGRAPGDAEETKCIRMTREFEGATESFPTLTFRFVRPGDAVPPYKHKRGEVPPTTVRGEIAREVRRRAQEYNVLASRWALDRLHRADQDADDEAVILAPEVVKARVTELHPKVQQAGTDARQFEDLVYVEALAQTDCQACGYESCRAYARAISLGAEEDLGRCEPGGVRSRRDTELLVQIRRGRWTKEGEAAPAETSVASA
jgi:NAD(P)H-quinone oxidoreductase subunit I